eukprot:s58_g48.t1
MFACPYSDRQTSEERVSIGGSRTERCLTIHRCLVAHVACARSQRTKSLTHPRGQLRVLARFIEFRCVLFADFTCPEGQAKALQNVQRITGIEEG